MEKKYKSTPDSMRELANQFFKEADSIKDTIGQMDSLFQKLQSDWETAIDESYAIRYQEVKPNLTKTEVLLREVAGVLDCVSAEVLVPETCSIDISTKFR